MKDSVLPDVQVEENPSNQFELMLRQHRRGIAADKASRILRKALLASKDTGAKSEVTIKVTLTPGTDDQMSIGIQVTAKLPDEKLPSGMFWVGDDGELLTSDPRQKELPLREVIQVGKPRQPMAKQA